MPTVLTPATPGELLHHDAKVGRKKLADELKKIRPWQSAVAQGAPN